MASGLQFLGDGTLKFGATSVHYGPKGNTTHFTVTCPNLATLVNYYNYIVQFGASGQFIGIEGGEVRELQVEVPGLTTVSAGILSELFFDQWELLSNESSDTIFANPILVGGNSPLMNYNDKTVLSRMARTGGTSLQAINGLNTDIKWARLTEPSYADGGVPDPDPARTGHFIFGPLTNGPASQLALEVQKGQIEYDRPTHVLRHTSYVSAGSTYNSARANVMRVYTTAQLLTEVGSGWTYNLPGRLYSEISSIPVQFAPAIKAPYYNWGWLKKITREPVLANFMVEIPTEYELGLWSNLRYLPK